MIKIQPTDNYKAIQDIAGKTWPVTYGAILSSEQIQYMFSMMYDLEALKNQAETKNHHFIIAGEDGNFLGFASYEFDYHGEPKTKIHKIYILPETQGKGIGKLLIDSIAQFAKENNSNSLFLNVNRFNKALTFYQKLGFKIIQEVDIELEFGYLMEDYVMEKEI